MEECFGINIGDYVAAAMKLGMPFTHIVIPIHGIRDDGGWFEVFRRALSDKPYIEVRPGGYGYFHVAKFFSERARRRVFDRVVQTLRDGQGQNRVVSVVCHSFGTYCVTKAILENADIRLYRLVMCGSIVPRLFPWNNVPAALPPGRIINDCGNNDSWPIVAQRLCKLCGEPGLYGDTGRLGFAHDPVTDRWHDVDHGGFFTEDIATNYWAPFITQGKIIPSPVALKPPGPWLSLLAGRWP
jgi:hypothetical protein